MISKNSVLTEQSIGGDVLPLSLCANGVLVQALQDGYSVVNMNGEAMIYPGKVTMQNVLELGGQNAFRNNHGGGGAPWLWFLV